MLDAEHAKVRERKHRATLARGHARSAARFPLVAPSKLHSAAQIAQNTPQIPHFWCASAAPPTAPLPVPRRAQQSTETPAPSHLPVRFHAASMEPMSIRHEHGKRRPTTPRLKDVARRARSANGTVNHDQK